MSTRRIAIIITLLLAVVFFVYAGRLEEPVLAKAESFHHQFGRLITKAGFGKNRENAMVVVGDIMLGRDVEKKIAAEGVSFPFRNVTNLLNGKVVIGNFEAAVPKVHMPTPALGMVFSVKKENLASLVEAGFTHFSLANNHAFDHGQKGFSDTKEALELYGFKVFGDPSKIASTSITRADISGLAVAIVALNATSRYPSEAELQAPLEEMQKLSDVQIAYIHWGEEYRDQHNSAQEELAHTLVDGGVDLIIGHHPHVVQDIEQYKEALIFYSLGNFVFDQYFSDEVEIGMLLRIEFAQNEGEIELILTDSRNSKASPQLMTGADRKIFLDKLSARSSYSIREDIAGGKVKFSY